MRVPSQCGAALISALALAVMIGLMAAGLSFVATSWQTENFEQQNKVYAEYVYEYAANEELNYMMTQLRTGQSCWGHSYTNGGYSDSIGPFTYFLYIQPGTNSVSGNQFSVNEVIESTTTGVTYLQPPSFQSGTTQSLFSIYGIFAVRDPRNGGTGASLTLSAGGHLTAVSNFSVPSASIGTNGVYSAGTGAILALNSPDYSINGDFGYSSNSGHQFTAGTIQKNPSAVVFPTIPQIIQYTFPACAGDTNAATWTYLESNIANGTIPLQTESPSATIGRIRTYKVGATGALSATNTMVANIPQTQTTLTNSGTGNGDWANANPDPNNAGKTALIFPPGDYFFSSMNLVYNANTEIIIDNKGTTLNLSASPTTSNPQVRFWFNGAGPTDTINLPLTFTDTTSARDAETFRIYYGSSGSTLSIGNSTTGALTYNGVIYGVSGNTTTGATISLTGGSTSALQMQINGAVIADNLIFNGYTKVQQLNTSGNYQDWLGAAGFTDTYYDQLRP